MPLYEYQCSACKHLWDDIYTIAKRNQPTKKPCPNCGKKKVVKSDASIQIIDAVRLGITRPDHGFKDVISKIKKAHPRNTMRDY
jgi:putative FmdB family regulatory protein